MSLTIFHSLGTRQNASKVDFELCKPEETTLLFYIPFTAHSDVHSCIMTYVILWLCMYVFDGYEHEAILKLKTMYVGIPKWVWHVCHFQLWQFTPGNVSPTSSGRCHTLYNCILCTPALFYTMARPPLAGVQLPFKVSSFMVAGKSCTECCWISINISIG